MYAYNTVPDAPPPDAVVVTLYRSGDMVRGYVRKVARPDEDDTIFPGEEMEPDDALMLARTHAEGAPIYVKLLEDVKWDERWGILQPAHDSPRVK